MNEANQKPSPSPVKEGKTLLIVRHAKSSWDVGTLNDFERPLNERGKKDAPMMAKRLLEKKVTIEAFVSSPAKRAKKTAELFAAAYGKTDEDVVYVSKLYHAAAEVFFEVVEELDERFSKVALFSHNPGISEFVNLLLDDVRIDDMPTCGVFAVQVQAEKWKDFKKSRKDFLFFDYPKLV